MPLRDVSFPLGHMQQWMLINSLLYSSTFRSNSYLYFGRLCILDHRSTDHPGYHMGQKSKDGKSKKLGPLGIIFIIATVSSILYLPG